MPYLVSSQGFASQVVPFDEDTEAFYTASQCPAQVCALLQWGGEMGQGYSRLVGQGCLNLLLGYFSMHRFISLPSGCAAFRVIYTD